MSFRFPPTSAAFWGTLGESETTQTADRDYEKNERSRRNEGVVIFQPHHNRFADNGKAIIAIIRVLFGQPFTQRIVQIFTFLLLL